MTAYYNEFEPFAAEWLRELIKEGHIAPGVVDTRSIEDVSPSDLDGFTQCHFFAGIGVWSYALRQAGWPDDRPVWTGSCPCQPFSAAGKGNGFADERHLWPAFFHLICIHRPGVVFGEQVASKDGLNWINLVHSDLEGEGYAVGAIDSCAASFGAPHIRQRMYWVADASGEGLEGGNAGAVGREREATKRGCGVVRLADADILNDDGSRSCTSANCWELQGQTDISGGQGFVCGLADAEGGGRREEQQDAGRSDAGNGEGETLLLARNSSHHRSCPTDGHWRDADWILCRDGKWRPVSASPQPMVDGSAESLGRVCDASVLEVEEEINATAMEAEVNPDEAMRDLWQNLVAEARQKWPAGRIPGLHETPFLLSFLRQLAEQGWRFKECASVSCEETPQETLRVLRPEHGASCPPYRYELAQQQSGKYPDTLRVLSSVLARHAHKAWDYAHKAYAESCFPLVHGAPNRVGRLRGYGNAIVAPQAQAFIEAYMGLLRQ